jgi:hypothetical protein
LSSIKKILFKFLDYVPKRRLINVNLSEWKYVGDYETEESFEILRVQRRVVPLRERGKQFSTLRQQTLKVFLFKIIFINQL